jgi:hypothetical protein
MGWFWSNTPTVPKPKGEDAAAQFPTAPPQQPPSPRDAEFADDPELQKFVTMIQEELYGRKAPPARPPVSSSQQQPETPESPLDPPPKPSGITMPWLRWRPSAASTDAYPPSSPAAAVGKLTSATTESSPDQPMSAIAVYPSKMSCRQAFDLAWGCQSMRGQLNHVYRYGEPRGRCSEHWDDFWFCMRMRSMSGEAKSEAIREHYREKEERKYLGKPSSEDVWEERREKVTPGTAFNMRLEASGVDDAAQNELDNRHRKRIRQQMGYED